VRTRLPASLRPERRPDGSWRAGPAYTKLQRAVLAGDARAIAAYDAWHLAFPAAARAFREEARVVEARIQAAILADPERDIAELAAELGVGVEAVAAVRLNTIIERLRADINEILEV